MELNKQRTPIGIFDSGLGGLTVAKTIIQALPEEDLLYFGDTAHTPWGDKSLAAIKKYALQICDILLKHHCKCIVIACHTASATVFETVKSFVGDKIPVINVIDPLLSHINAVYQDKKIGLIGTKQTIRSNRHQEKIHQLKKNIELVTLATPLLVPLIEEGFIGSPASKMILQHYLSHPSLADIQALILGCTHYPFLKQEIHEFYENKIDIIDAAELTATALKHRLTELKLLAGNGEGNTLQGSPHRQFYVSDLSEFASQTSQQLFQNQIHLQAYPLGENDA